MGCIGAEMLPCSFWQKFKEVQDRKIAIDQKPTRATLHTDLEEKCPAYSMGETFSCADLAVRT